LPARDARASRPMAMLPSPDAIRTTGTADILGPQRRAGAPKLIGVLNISPESNVPGSVATTGEEIDRKARDLIAQGADMIEIGARSTNPRAPRIDDGEERRRLLPVLAALKGAGWPVAVDTWSLATAVAALEAGADMINFTASEPADDLYRAVAATGAALFLTYLPYPDAYAMREGPRREYGPEAILAYFAAQRRRARALGCSPLIADPNLGIFHPDLDDYEKIAYQLQAMEVAPRLQAEGFPVLLYCARKECLTSRIIYAALLLRLGVEYIRIHEPAIARRLLPSGGRPPLAPPREPHAPS